MTIKSRLAYDGLPAVPRLCLIHLERFKGDVEKAAKVLGIPARSVRMYSEQGRAMLGSVGPPRVEES